jgi:hypothetical protein
MVGEKISQRQAKEARNKKRRRRMTMFLLKYLETIIQNQVTNFSHFANFGQEQRLKLSNCNSSYTYWNLE